MCSEATDRKFSGSACTNKNDIDEKNEKARFLQWKNLLAQSLLDWNMKHDIVASGDRWEIKFDYKLIDPLPSTIDGALNIRQTVGVLCGE